MIIEEENQKWNFKSWSQKIKKFSMSNNFPKFSKCPEITESSAAVIVSMYWMTHSIEWSLKKKIGNKISKVEVRKNENAKSKMF